MLVLSQKLGNTIKIGDSITIKILDIRQDSVRIGVDAPREISVHRQVVYDKLKAQATTGSESESTE
jgi:carbon storage regulator